MTSKETKKLKQYGREYFVDYWKDRLREGNRVYSYNLSEILKISPNAKNILDVGCATGEFLSYCDKKELITYGFDVSDFAIKKARENTKANLLVLDATGSKWPYKDNLFDIVTVFDVVEHIKTADNIFSEAMRVLKPGGLIYITTPNDLGKVGRFLERFMPEDPTHINKKTAGKWKKEFNRFGFQKIVVRGVLLHGFPPSPHLRRRLERVGVPTIIKPIFFPMKFITGTLYINANKPL